jgi:hypothetical protein
MAGDSEFRPRHHVLTRAHTYQLESTSRTANAPSHLSSQALGQLMRSVGGDLLKRGASDNLSQKEREWTQEQKNRKLGLGYSFSQHSAPQSGEDAPYTTTMTVSSKVRGTSPDKDPRNRSNPSVLRPVKVTPVEEISGGQGHIVHPNTSANRGSHRPHSAAAAPLSTTLRSSRREGGGGGPNQDNNSNIDLSVVGRPHDQHSVEALLCSAPPASYGKITASLGGGDSSTALAGVRGGHEVINSLKPRSALSRPSTAKKPPKGGA